MRRMFSLCFATAMLLLSVGCQPSAPPAGDSGPPKYMPPGRPSGVTAYGDAPTKDTPSKDAPSGEATPSADKSEGGTEPAGKPEK